MRSSRLALAAAFLCAPCDAAVAFRAQAAHNETNPTTTLTITIPASVQSGDVVYVAATSRNHTSGTAFATCTDNDSGGNTWTTVQTSTDRKANLFRKVATSATASKTVTIGGCVNSCSGALSAFSGTDTTTPETNLSLEANASGNETHAGFTPSSANSMVVITVHPYADDNNFSTFVATDPSTLPNFQFTESVGGSDCAAGIASGGPQSGGPNATGNIGWTQGVNNVSYSIAWALQPPAGGGPTCRTHQSLLGVGCK